MCIALTDNGNNKIRLSTTDVFNTVFIFKEYSSSSLARLIFYIQAGLLAQIHHRFTPSQTNLVAFVKQLPFTVAGPHRS
jgi:hypothetical protein